MSERVVEAVMFADLAGFTALTNAHGDEHGYDIARRFFDLVGRARADRATLVKTIGDAVMLADDDACELVDIALTLQGLLEVERMFPSVRMGLDHGPLLLREGDRYGETVNIAARVAAYARSGQVLATAAVHAASRHPAARAIGPVQLRGLAQPIQLYELGAQREELAIDPVCRMRVAVPAAASLPFGGQEWHFCSFECARRFALEPSFYAMQ